MKATSRDIFQDGKNWDLDAERDLWRAICAPGTWFNDEGTAGTTHPESLWYFIHIAWGAEWHFASGHRRWLVRESASGYHIHDKYLTWLQNNILEWKEQRKDGNGKRLYLQIILPRNFGKSITATRCASLWCHLDEPDMSTLLGSATTKLAEDFLGTISKTISAQNIGLSWFCWLYGNWYNPSREWTKTAFHHGYRNNTALQEPSFDITAADTGMTGYHPYFVVWDDPLIKNKLRDGGTYLDTAHVAFNATYKALQPDGLLMLVCTRYLDDDISGRHLLEEGVHSWEGMECPNTMIFQKHEMGDGQWRVFFWQVEDELTGTPTCPEIMDAERIASEKSMDGEDFACQYQNNPGTSTHAPLLESQLRDCFMDYALLRNDIAVENATVHLDTAFKNAENIKKGDYNAIVTWLHDAAPTGTIYLHTDLLRHSNEWRSEQFADEVVGVLNILRRAQYSVRMITDEKEMGGKEGVYKQNLTATIKGAGFPRVPPINQFARQGTTKRARIRKSAGYWADGYVKILLHKDAKGNWIIPPVAKALFNQIMRVDVVTHDDLADAAADVFQPGVWRKPIFDQTRAVQEGMEPRSPGDAGLRAMNRPLTNEELKVLLDEEKLYGDGYNNGLGPDESWLPDRSPYG